MSTAGRDPGRVDVTLFDEVADGLRAMLPPELGEPRIRAQRYGVKLWFESADPNREHYEAQVVGAKHVPTARVLALEVGFHAEHRRAEDNDATLDRIRRRERSWRRALGPEPELGPFLGRDGWSRVSEVWPDPDLGDPTLPFELATRLTDYATALEPARRAR
jgi:hypothetical protein